MRFAVNKKYIAELLFLLLIPLQMGYNNFREGVRESLPPLCSALEYGVDYQNDVCDAGQYLNNVFGDFQPTLGLLFWLLAHLFTSFLIL